MGVCERLVMMMSKVICGTQENDHDASITSEKLTK